MRLRGPLDDLAALASAHPDAWFACEVELDGPAMDVVHRVRETVPGALRIEALSPGPAGASPEPDAEAAAAGAASSTGISSAGTSRPGTQ